MQKKTPSPAGGGGGRGKETSSLLQVNDSPVKYLNHLEKVDAKRTDEAQYPNLLPSKARALFAGNNIRFSLWFFEVCLYVRSGKKVDG
jgi:hypothetical protein